MEFLDPVAKKRKKQRLYIGYLLVAILIGLATYILVATAVGYEIFPRNGEIVQNGLLFVNSSPGDAAVSLNGNLEQDRTQSKFALVGGAYDLTISKDGYVNWNKKVVVEGGKVRFVTYPKLFPTILSPTTVQTINGSTGISSQSPDRKWLVVQPNPTIPSFTFYDLENKELASTSFVLPTGSVIVKDGNFGSFSLIEWSSDNKHFLLQQDAADGKRYFIVVDRTSADATINLNLLFSSDPTKVSLFDKKHDRFYFYYSSDGSIRQANSSDKVIEQPILDQVLAFKSYGDNLISYATSKDSQAGLVSIKIWDSGKIYDFTETAFDPNSNYLLDIAKFRNNWYYPVGSASSQRVIIYRNPLDAIAKQEPTKPTVATSLRLDNPQAIEFSTNSRFLMAQSGQALHVYDLEDKVAFRFDVAEPLDPGVLFDWMDGHRLQYTSGGKLYVVEFDGNNQRELIPVTPSSVGFFSNNYEKLYSLLRQPNGTTALQQTSLLVEQD